MSSPLTALEPRPVWSHFDAIRRIPRPSKHEQEISRHVREWAARHGFAVRADQAGNLLVSVPASPGRERAPAVVLQAHLDMVCEKNAGVEHDFLRDPIRVEIAGDWVRAIGTTLGADNGLGAAAAMAAATDPEVVHGPLELLFTLDEETGLNGASALDPALVTARLLINLDTEEDDAVYIGCAGAGGIEATLALERRAEPDGGRRYLLSVRGLRGGHSGMDIIENRGNAIKIAAHLLTAALDDGVDLRVVAFDGGSKRNAIARECFVELALGQVSAARLDELVTAARPALEAELGAVEPGLAVALEPAAEPKPWPPIAAAFGERLLRTLAAAPHGVLAMSREVPGLVETSNNLAVVETGAEHAVVTCSFRSSVNAARETTRRTLDALFRLAGFEVASEAGYPGWKPDPDSPLVRRTVAVYERLFDAPPAVKAVHAGLECGILVEKLPGLDAVSIGPEIRNAHSPDEKARISSSQKFYRLLRELLADLAVK